MSNPNSLSLAGAGAGALGLAGAGALALAGSGALAAAVGLNENANSNGNENANGNGNENGNGNGNLNGNLNANGSLNANVNGNVNYNHSETNVDVETKVKVDLDIDGKLSLEPPEVIDSYNTTIQDSIYIPEPGYGTYVLANGGGSAAIYNGDVFNFGDGDGTQSVFDLDQTNSLVDIDVAAGINASSTGSIFSFDAACLEAGDVSVGNGIGKADNISHATNSVAASADASVNFSAFDQTVTMGANIQYNTANQTVIGGSEINYGNTFGDVDTV
jgi:hypothetical protein